MAIFADHHLLVYGSHALVKNLDILAQFLVMLLGHLLGKLSRLRLSALYLIVPNPVLGETRVQPLSELLEGLFHIVNFLFVH